MKILLLTQGQYAIVDLEDYERLAKWKWYAVKHRYTFYAVRHLKEDGVCRPDKRLIRMHREILYLKNNDNRIVDHKNRNGLDNRRSNLRVVNNSLNSYNCKMQSSNKSGYRGVSWDSRTKKWRAQIQINKKFIYCGEYVELKKAALAYNEMAFSYWGSNAILNIIGEK